MNDCGTPYAPRRSQVLLDIVVWAVVALLLVATLALAGYELYGLLLSTK